MGSDGSNSIGLQCWPRLKAWKYSEPVRITPHSPVSIHVVIVGVVDSVMLKGSDCTIIVIAIRSIGRTYHPKVIEVGYAGTAISDGCSMISPVRLCIIVFGAFIR